MRELKKEVWLPLRNFEDYMVISNMGNIKILERYCSNNKGVRKVAERILTPHVTKNKYKYSHVAFNLNNKKHFLVVARAVYETFNNIDLDKKKSIVHKDGNKLNNRLDNIKIISRRSIKTGENKTGFVGVNACSHKRSYAASIVFQGVRVHLHHSKSKEECHKIYQLAKSMIDEYDKLKAGILSNSRLNHKLVEQKIKLYQD